MGDLEKQIEEAAYKYGNKTNSHVGDNNFIVGAKSEAAKEYWQQGMYSEEEVFNLIDRIYTTGIYQMETYNKSMNLKAWFDQNKKKYGYPETNGKKFKAELGRGTGISSLGKLVAKNANRSVIKAKRQKAKKEIEQVLSEDDNLDIEREVFL